MTLGCGSRASLRTRGERERWRRATCPRKAPLGAARRPPGLFAPVRSDVGQRSEHAPRCELPGTRSRPLRHTGQDRASVAASALLLGICSGGGAASAVRICARRCARQRLARNPRWRTGMNPEAVAATSLSGFVPQPDLHPIVARSLSFIQATRIGLAMGSQPLRTATPPPPRSSGSPGSRPGWTSCRGRRSPGAAAGPWRRVRRS